MDFKPFHAKRKLDGCIYNIPRKKYDSTNCHVKHRRKLEPLIREHATIIMLRKHGHRINHLADAFFRSTSYIQKILSQAKLHGSIPVIDQRKMPSQIRNAQAQRRWKSLDRWMQLWEGFKNGTEDKPP